MADGPVRVQRKRTAGWKMPENTVVVDRSTRFGNPFPVSRGTSRSMGVTKPMWTVGTWTGPGLWFKDSRGEAVALAVDAYRIWVNSPKQERLRFRATTELRGKNLACWCPLPAAGEPDCCHASVLLEIANAPLPGGSHV